MKRAATLVLVMLAMSASAAVDARALASEGQKTQWAPTRNFSSLNARAVFASESRAATSPYAGEEGKTAAGGKEAGFTGYRTEDALGLFYARRRWLDSSTGTWLSKDDIGAASYLQSPNELNAWLYAAGNPTRYTDPDGRRPPTLEEEGELNEMAQVVDELRTERAKLSGWRQTLAGLGNDGLELVERNLNQRRDAIALAEECWGRDCQPQPVVFGALAQANAEGGGSPFGFVFDGDGFPYLFTQEGVTVNQLPLFPNWHGYDIHDQVASADRGVMENVDRAFRLLDALKGGRLAARRPGTRGKNPFAPVRTPATDGAVRKFLGIEPKPPERTPETGRAVKKFLGVGQPRDKAGQFDSDPEAPRSPNVFTDAQRKAEWKRIAQDPTSPLTPAERAEVLARGRGPQRLNPRTGKLETMELSHEPVPLREGGTEVVPRWPDDHAAVDPFRHVGN